MKKIIFLSAISLLLFVNLALAQDNSLPNPGLTPDSPFYFLKSWKESVQMFFTFGAENKAKQFLHLADVRLTEYQKMIEAGKTDIALKTLKKYEKQLDQAMTKIKEAEEKGATAELDTMRRDGRLKQQEILKGISEKMPEAVKKTVVEERQKQWINFLSEVKGKFPEAIPGPIESGTLPMELLLNCPLPSVPAPESCGVKWLISSVQNCPYFNCPSVGKTQAPPERLAEPPQQTESEKSIEPGGVCIQVITPATGPDGTCKEFPTPCDVPADWKKVDKCPQAATIPPTTTEKPIIGQAPTEIRYYTCPDGTKVESGKCYAGGGCIIQMTPELQCPASTPPVTKGGECQTLGEIKYYQCPSSSQISQVPWCGCGAASPLAGAKNIWRCQYLPELSCPKPAPIPTPTPTEPLSYTSCTKGGMKDHACSDGTMVRWQCQCFTHDVAISSADYHYDCDLEPAKYCSASNVSAPLTVTRINVRLQEGAKSPSIFWTTNVPVLSYIEHGPTAYYGFRDNGLPNTPDTNFVVWSLTQGGTSIESKLQPDTLYHFRIVAEDTKGNKFVSQDYTFFTGQ